MKNFFFLNRTRGHAYNSGILCIEKSCWTSEFTDIFQLNLHFLKLNFCKKIYRDLGPKYWNLSSDSKAKIKKGNWKINSTNAMVKLFAKFAEKLDLKIYFYGRNVQKFSFLINKLVFFLTLFENKFAASN